MPEIGQTISHYRIVQKIGQGGMGEVFLAEDLSLDRKVALKFLTDAFTGDPERMARFEREAKILASLNHPNIAGIYGLEQVDGKRFLVLEYVAGETLKASLSKGALPLENALELCRQIAEGLEAAHEKGIIHRDLKPANVMITAEEKIKILDFGLAKALADDTQSIDSPQSPTITEAMTRPGVVLGTAAYMSPEQAKGKAVDKRTDIWAFGCILYECLTGKRAFEGETVTETLAAVITKEPELEKVAAKARPLLERCLVKDPKKRLRDIGEAMAWLDTAPIAVESESIPIRRPWLAWSIAAVSIAALLVALWAPWHRMPPVSDLIRFQITLPEEVIIRNDSLFSLSPDGRYLAFAAFESGGTNHLWIYRFDSMEVRGLAGTELGLAAQCFWSPDSRFIAFQTGGRLKKVSVSGGPPETICDLSGDAIGGSWNRDNVIIFGTLGGGLMCVSGNGGTVSPVTRLNPEREERYHVSPTFLPDGHHFLYFSTSVNPENTGVYLGSLDAKPEEQAAKQLVKASCAASYMPATDYVPGQLIFMRDQILKAQPFDDKQMELIGESVSVVDNVGSFYGNGYFSVSASGVLSYRPGEGITNGGKYELVWMDREGKKIGSVSQAGQYSNFRLSADEKKIVFHHTESGSHADVYVLDLIHDVTSRLTFNAAIENLPIWSPDGLQILFPSNRNGYFDLYLKAATGAGQEELLVKLGTPTGWGTDWSRDGRFILYQIPGDKTGQDLWIAPQFDDQKPFPYLQSQFNEQGGMFSPDGKWIAYVSDETDRNEIYVQSFPLSGAKFQVSSGGGSEPSWSTDGKELFYVAADSSLMALPVKLSPIFERGQPKRLMSVPVQGYAVSSDSKRFLILNPTEEETAQSIAIRVILNWTSLLGK
jgi:serine/threonine protein kinase/Tol biopolymer transport system component